MAVSKKFIREALENALHGNNIKRDGDFL